MISQVRLRRLPPHSGDCLHQPALDADRGAVHPGGQRTADERHDAGDFVHRLKPLEQRGRPHFLEELLREFRKRLATAELVDEIRDTLRTRGTEASGAG